MSRSPIDNGALFLRGADIVAVGPARRVLGHAPAGTPVFDLGEVAVLPGLVNAHAHLDYTDMAGQLLPPRSFTDWIKLITEAKSGWARADFVVSWKNGARMLLESGTTTVADIEAVPDILPEVWAATPLRVISFLEITGVRSRLDPETVIQDMTIRAQQLSSGPGATGFAPHAPYSTTPAMLRRAATTARAHRWPLSTHVAESVEEDDMFRHARGPMFDWLQRNRRDMSDCGIGSPVAHLERHGLLGPDLLAVHANCIDRHDVRRLARRGPSVVHCPRSHAYFGHPPFQYHALTRAGVRVCLGTDSLATVLTKRGQPVALDLFAEMRAFADAFPEVRPGDILRLCTTAGAAALGRQGRAGCLKAGAAADLIAVACTTSPRHVEESVLAHVGPVTVSMIGGRFVLGGTDAD